MTAGSLAKEYEDLRDTVADFARTVVAPVSAKHDEEHSFPYEVVAKMAEMGLFGLPFPEEYGGMGGDSFSYWSSRCRRITTSESCSMLLWAITPSAMKLCVPFTVAS